jgi:MoxR-like ATPase
MLLIIFSSETSVEQFLGSVVFESSGFQYVPGPLIRAVEEGCVFLADEFNLLTPAVMLSLVPFLTARPGEEVISDSFPDAVIVARGFVFVATGNSDVERGRVQLPAYVKSLLCLFEVCVYFYFFL